MMQWLKAKSSKYKHLYRDKEAACGSPAKPYWAGNFHRQMEGIKCPRCLKLEAKAHADSGEEVET